MPKNGQYKVTVEHRITKLEEAVYDIRDNHLVHLAENIKDLNKKMDRGNWIVISALGGIVVDLIMRLLK